MLLPSIAHVAGLRGKRVFLRSDLNVPVEKSAVRNEFRIRRSLATIELLRKEGARVIVGTHSGRDGMSVRPIAEALRSLVPVSFIPEVVGPHVSSAVSSMKPGEVVIIENLRRDLREERNDSTFAAELAALADCYVNDAFAVSHRAHASIVGLPRLLPHYAGLLFLDEVEHLSEAISPRGKSVAILGGAKFETKIPLVEKLLAAYDTVVVAGALANDFFRAQGFATGVSLTSNFPIAGLVPLLSHPRIIVPADVTVAAPGGTFVKKPDAVLVHEKIVDIGPETLRAVISLVSGADFVLWNGPLGYYEDGYTEHTETLARAIAFSRARSVVGGGDTVAAIDRLDLGEKFDFLSTAGGAMLEFLLKGTLPGIEALRTRSS